ncbi:hypothetical protein QBC42DRAFT_222813 [Cladorrhinum samala]|uniref:BRCT domain-containing protein n=1 Tax=Cladorrhinum samala TaxID=585594 RepID=A0AAV9HTU7_9PEZI|nr:hypothetical protein QBC42DRAFT_222813 [Cladorrhinum samala]
MPLPHPKFPPLAEPSISRKFDPWNSSSTGHQLSESRGPQGWRQSRNIKMNHQFRAGPSGGERISDAVGVGSEEYDETLKMLVPKELRMRAQKSVADMLHNPGSMKSPLKKSVMARGEENEDEGDDDGMTEEERHMEKPRLGPLDKNDAMISKEPRDAAKQQRKIFDGLTIYINGSTHPHISDHALKHLLAENGANMSLHLGRRQLQKEIRRVRGCGVKYVGVEWVLESIKAGKRLSETRFQNLKIAPRGQQSVFGAFSKAE